MCNKLHEDAQPIEPEGKGWKITHRVYDTNYAMVDSTPYTKSTDGWIYWQIQYYGDGFCIFLDKKAGEKVLDAWRRAAFIDRGFFELVPVEYKDGLGKLLTNNICPASNGYEFAIVKQFRFID